MWKPTLSPPQVGQLKVFVSDHPAADRVIVLDQSFEPSDVSAEAIAEAVLDAAWSLQPNTSYEVEIKRSDVNWGADASAIEVVVIISSLIGSLSSLADLVLRIREALDARQRPSRDET